MLIERIFEVFLSGVTLGCIYAVIGLGFMVFFNVTKIFSFTVGEFAMLGGMISASLYSIGLPLAVAIILAVLASCTVSIIVWLFFLHRPFSQGNPAVTIIFITLGIHLLISGVAYIVWGTAFKEIPYFSQVSPLVWGGATISPQSLWIWGITSLTIIGLSLLFDRTLLGKGLRACAIQPLAAKLMGINPLYMAFASFILAAAVASIGGVTLAPLTMTQYGVGVGLTMKGVLAAAVGGMKKARGPILGGLTMGLTESFVGAFISSKYMVAAALGVFIALLLVRPQGIFGVKEEV